MLCTVVALLSSALLARGQSASSSFSPTPVTTAVPAPTTALNSSVIGQGIYPPLQGMLCTARRDGLILALLRLV
jgi:alpha,alpha-trehalase